MGTAQSYRNDVTWFNLASKNSHERLQICTQLGKMSILAGYRGDYHIPTSPLMNPTYKFTGFVVTSSQMNSSKQIWGLLKPNSSVKPTSKSDRLGCILLFQNSYVEREVCLYTTIPLFLH